MKKQLKKLAMLTLAISLLGTACGTTTDTEETAASARVFDESIPLADTEFWQPNFDIVENADFADLIVIGSVINYREAVEEQRDTEDVDGGSIVVNDAVIIKPTEILKGEELLPGNSGRGNITVTIGAVIDDGDGERRVLLPAVETLRPGIESRSGKPSERPQFVLFLQDDDSTGQRRFIMPAATSAMLLDDAPEIIDEVVAVLE